MKRRKFIKSFVLIFSFLFIKPTRLFPSINLFRLGKKAPDLSLNSFNKNNPNQKEWFLDDFSGEWLNPSSKRNTFMLNPKGIVVYKWIGVRPI